MSEHQIQREPQGHIDVPNETVNSDPLAELAKIVAGEVPGARRDVVVPISSEPVPESRAVNTPVQTPQAQQQAPGVQVVTQPVAPVQAPAPVISAPNFQSENMDLESQLMAELGVGEPEMMPAPQVRQAPAPAQVTQVPETHAPVASQTSEALSPVVAVPSMEKTDAAPAAPEMAQTPSQTEAPKAEHSVPSSAVVDSPVDTASASHDDFAQTAALDAPISNDEFSDAFSAQMAGRPAVEETQIESVPTEAPVPTPAPAANPVEVAPTAPQTQQADLSEVFKLDDEMEEFSTEAFAEISDETADLELESFEASLSETLAENHDVETPQVAVNSPIEPEAVQYAEVNPVQDFVSRQNLSDNQFAIEQVEGNSEFGVQSTQQPALAAPMDNSIAEPIAESAPAAQVNFEDDFSEAFGDELSLELSSEQIAEPAIVHQAAAEPMPVQNDEFEAAMFALHQNEIDVQQPAQISQPVAPVIAASASVPAGVGAQQPQQQTHQQFREPESFQPIDTQFDAMNAAPQNHETEVVLPPVRRKFGVGLAAGALGLALVAGAGFVGYGYFNGSGEVLETKIVRAEPGDFKVKPEVPGGKKIANQDQPVYDSIAGNQTDTASQENLVATNVEPIAIASAEPQTRSFKSSERLATAENNPPEDSAVATMQPRKVKTVTVRADGTIITSTGSEIANLTAIAPIEPDTAAQIGQPVEIAATNSIDGAATTGDIAVPSLKPSRDAKPAIDAGAPDENVVLANTVPVTRVKTATRSLATPELVAPKPVSVTSIKPSQPVVSAPASGEEFVVQISSQRSQEAAEATYQNLKRRFASLLSDRSREIREATVEGKGTFYRVRIPVGSQTAAAEFCGRYKSAGGSCFVTR